jgi:hypothetical protein
MIVQTELYRNCELRVAREKHGYQVEILDPAKAIIGSTNLHSDPDSALNEAIAFIDARAGRQRAERYSEAVS